MDVTALQVVVIVLGSNATLVAALAYIIQKFGPNLLDWMKRKVDEKNGSIGELVGETKRLALSIQKLAEAILAGIEQGQERQGQQLEAMQRNCQAHTQQMEKLMQSIEDHRAA